LALRATTARRELSLEQPAGEDRGVIAHADQQ
jgi:hypothetical protein